MLLGTIDDADDYVGRRYYPGTGKDAQGNFFEAGIAFDEAAVKKSGLPQTVVRTAESRSDAVAVASTYGVSGSAEGGGITRAVLPKGSRVTSVWDLEKKGVAIRKEISAVLRARADDALPSRKPKLLTDLFGSLDVLNPAVVSDEMLLALQRISYDGGHLGTALGYDAIIGFGRTAQKMERVASSHIILLNRSALVIADDAIGAMDLAATRIDEFHEWLEAVRGLTLDDPVIGADGVEWVVRYSVGPHRPELLSGPKHPYYKEYREYAKKTHEATSALTRARIDAVIEGVPMPPAAPIREVELIANLNQPGGPAALVDELYKAIGGGEFGDDGDVTNAIWGLIGDAPSEGAVGGVRLDRFGETIFEGRTLAELQAMTPEDARRWLDEINETVSALVQTELDDADLLVAVGDSTLAKIAKGDHRLKTQFETGTSVGTLDPDLRASGEFGLFGYVPEVDPSPTSSSMRFTAADELSEIVEQIGERLGDDVAASFQTIGVTDRPIYGFIGDVTHVDAGSSGGQAYGNVTVRLNDEVRSRTTVTFGDSLSAGMDQTSDLAQLGEKGLSLPQEIRERSGKFGDALRPSPIQAVDAAQSTGDVGTFQTVVRGVTSSIDGETAPGVPARVLVRDPARSSFLLADDLIDTIGNPYTGARYIEAQYHGGLSLADIADVTIQSQARPFIPSHAYDTVSALVDGVDKAFTDPAIAGELLLKGAKAEKVGKAVAGAVTEAVESVVEGTRLKPGVETLEHVRSAIREALGDTPVVEALAEAFAPAVEVAVQAAELQVSLLGEGMLNMTADIGPDWLGSVMRMKAVEPDIGVRVGLVHMATTLDALETGVQFADEAAGKRLIEWTQDVLDQAATEYGVVVDEITAATLLDKYAIVATTG